MHLGLIQDYWTNKFNINQIHAQALLKYPKTYKNVNWFNKRYSLNRLPAMEMVSGERTKRRAWFLGGGLYSGFFCPGAGVGRIMVKNWGGGSRGVAELREWWMQDRRREQRVRSTRVDKEFVFFFFLLDSGRELCVSGFVLRTFWSLNRERSRERKRTATRRKRSVSNRHCDSSCDDAWGQKNVK